ncbi:MAG: lysophospholipid acyltransferase family protein [Alphaproteobacteria bacterium]
MLSCVVTLFIRAYVLLLRGTCKVSITGLEHPTHFWQKGQPVVLAMWHGRVFAMPFVLPAPLPTKALISLHKDGRLMAAIAGSFGVGAIDGSSKRGGAKALREMAQALQNGTNVSITPDAPPTPVYTCAQGVAEVARLGHAPIIPIAFSTTCGVQLRVRDRFVVPLPFGHIRIVCGQALSLSGKDSKALLAQTQASLHLLTQATDATCGHAEWSV